MLARIFKKASDGRKAVDEVRSIEPHDAYKLIQNIIIKYNYSIAISQLCEIAKVNRSGYYAWVAATKYRANRDNFDFEDYKQISEIYTSTKQKAG